MTPPLSIQFTLEDLENTLFSADVSCSRYNSKIADHNNILIDLLQVDWEELVDEDCVNDMVDFLYRRVFFAIDNDVPKFKVLNVSK